MSARRRFAIAGAVLFGALAYLPTLALRDLPAVLWVPIGMTFGALAGSEIGKLGGPTRLVVFLGLIGAAVFGCAGLAATAFLSVLRPDIGFVAIGTAIGVAVGGLIGASIGTAVTKRTQGQEPRNGLSGS